MKKNPAPNIAIPVLLFILAYEWLVSFANKLLVKDYYASLHQQMVESLSGIQVKPYAYLVKNIGLPHYQVIGTLVVIGELFVGASFAFLAVRQLQNKMSRSICWLGLVASAVAAFMSCNYALLGGDTLFVDPANAFQEGISIDWILFLVEAMLALQFYLLARRGMKAVENTLERSTVNQLRTGTDE